MSWQSLSNAFIHQLYISTPGSDLVTPVILPNLTTLALEDRHDFTDDELFVSMLQSRRQLNAIHGRAVAQLRVVTLVLEREMGQNARVKVEAMRSRDDFVVRVWSRAWSEEERKWREGDPF